MIRKTSCSRCTARVGGGMRFDWSAAGAGACRRIAGGCGGRRCCQPGTAGKRSFTPALKPPAIEKAMRKVADWQLRTAEDRFSTDWTYAALYDGLLAASRTTGDSRYHDAVLKFAERTGGNWVRASPMADDEAVAQSYLELYAEHGAPERMAAIKAEADKLLQRPDDSAKDLWWWCDALFMAPPALARLSRATGDTRYLDYMDREWWLTSAHLYDPAAHLYSRDASYLARRERMVQSCSGRAGTAGCWQVWRVFCLTCRPIILPAPYVAQFREMAQAVAAIQGSDGLWRSGLLDPGAYPYPEVSGSAFFTFALAWGINEGLLDEDIRARGGQSLAGTVDAHLCRRPARLNPENRRGTRRVESRGSYVYGVGAFLLAGSEVDKLSRNAH